ncbi:MAG: SWIB/MDM2 domain-containing protein [bacterium]
MPKGAALKKVVIKVDDSLAVIYGKKKTITAVDLTKGVWVYIKAHKLMKGTGPLMKRTIDIPAEVQPIFGKVKTIKVGEISKKLWNYIKVQNLRP